MVVTALILWRNPKAHLKVPGCLSAPGDEDCQKQLSLALMFFPISPILGLGVNLGDSHIQGAQHMCQPLYHWNCPTPAQARRHGVPSGVQGPWRGKVRKEYQIAAVACDVRAPGGGGVLAPGVPRIFSIIISFPCPPRAFFLTGGP